MKRVFILLCLFSLPLIACAQAPLTIDPAVQAAVQDALPAKYASYGSAIILALMILGRTLKALADGRGIKGWLSAIWLGTNNSAKVLIALFTLGACACSTPAQNERLGQLALLAVDLAAKRGAITADDAEALKQAKAIVLPDLPTVDHTSTK